MLTALESGYTVHRGVHAYLAGPHAVRRGARHLLHGESGEQRARRAQMRARAFTRARHGAGSGWGRTHSVGRACVYGLRAAETVRQFAVRYFAVGCVGGNSICRGRRAGVCIGLSAVNRHTRIGKYCLSLPIWTDFDPGIWQIRVFFYPGLWQSIRKYMEAFKMLLRCLSTNRGSRL